MSFKTIQPLVSVIIPNYNCKKYIIKALNSVLNQTYNNIEVIVVDDCSQDDSVDVIKKYISEDNRFNITLVVNDINKGVSASRNTGISLAKGEYIALLDSDDLWKADKIELQIAKLLETQADICYTSYDYIGLEGEYISSYCVTSKTDYEALLAENVIGCSTAVIKNSDKIAFNTDKDIFHEDYLLWLDMLKAGKKAVGLSQSLVEYRIGGRSSSKLKAAKNRWIIYRKTQKMPLFVALKYFFKYAVNGFKKYKKIN